MSRSRAWLLLFFFPARHPRAPPGDDPDEKETRRKPRGYAKHTMHAAIPGRVADKIRHPWPHVPHMAVDLSRDPVAPRVGLRLSPCELRALPRNPPARPLTAPGRRTVCSGADASGFLHVTPSDGWRFPNQILVSHYLQPYKNRNLHPLPTSSPYLLFLHLRSASSSSSSCIPGAHPGHVPDLHEASGCSGASRGVGGAAVLRRQPDPGRRQLPALRRPHVGPILPPPAPGAPAACRRGGPRCRPEPQARRGGRVPGLPGGVPVPRPPDRTAAGRVPRDPRRHRGRRRGRG